MFAAKSSAGPQLGEARLDIVDVEGGYFHKPEFGDSLARMTH